MFQWQLKRAVTWPLLASTRGNWTLVAAVRRLFLGSIIVSVDVGGSTPVSLASAKSIYFIVRMLPRIIIIERFFDRNLKFPPRSKQKKERFFRDERQTRASEEGKSIKRR